MNPTQLRPIRLEIALLLINSPHPDAKKVLAGMIKTDPVIGTILKQYGVET